MLPVTGEYKGATGQCWCARATYTHINKSAQHFPTLKIDFYFLYTECGGLVCLFVCFIYVGARLLNQTTQQTLTHTQPSSSRRMKLGERESGLGRTVPATGECW